CVIVDIVFTADCLSVSLPCSSCFFESCVDPRELLSFPTRRSSDLGFSFFTLGVDRFPKIDLPTISVRTSNPGAAPEEIETEITEDRKSTRLNSSHVKISYAVFCLKKKK